MYEALLLYKSNMQSAKSSLETSQMGDEGEEDSGQRHSESPKPKYDLNLFNILCMYFVAKKMVLQHNIFCSGIKSATVSLFPDSQVSGNDQKITVE